MLLCLDSQVYQGIDASMDTLKHCAISIDDVSRIQAAKFFNKHIECVMYIEFMSCKPAVTAILNFNSLIGFKTKHPLNPYSARHHLKLCWRQVFQVMTRAEKEAYL